jgi:Fe-Mn family superoxide dismutase
MAINLMPLPYAVDSLAPAISAETLKLHHGKHHKGYVTKTNELVAGTELEAQPLEAIIASARKSGDSQLFNQAAQVWNHGFYWLSLAPGKTEPSESLAAAIAASFGSAQQMVDELVEAAMGQFASGWAWLSASREKLEIETTGDAEQPLGEGKRTLLVIDVWEHAYYLDRHNDRKAYLEAVMPKLNWRFASENFARDEPWSYPGQS